MPDLAAPAVASEHSRPPSSNDGCEDTEHGGASRNFIQFVQDAQSELDRELAEIDALQHPDHNPLPNDYDQSAQDRVWAESDSSQIGGCMVRAEHREPRGNGTGQEGSPPPMAPAAPVVALDPPHPHLSAAQPKLVGNGGMPLSKYLELKSTPYLGASLDKSMASCGMFIDWSLDSGGRRHEKPFELIDQVVRNNPLPKDYNQPARDRYWAENEAVQFDDEKPVGRLGRRCRL